MPTVLLVRHGRTAANSDGVLAGRMPGIELDEVGRAQVRELGRRVARLPITRIVTSPLERTMRSAQALLDATEPSRADRAGADPSMAPPRPEIMTDDRLLECDYGQWTGRHLKELVKEPQWATVQSHPSAAEFPGGERLVDVQRRGVAAVRDHDAQVSAEHGPNALWIAVTHGDVVKAILADALGMHQDLFQRIVVNPGSVSAVTYTQHRPFVVRCNDVGADLSGLIPAAADDAPSDAVVGGGA